MAAIRKVAIVGKGALGLLYGTLLSETLGQDAIYYLVDDARYEAYASRPAPTVNGVPCTISNVRASDAEPVDLIIVVVKSMGLEDALDEMKGAVGPNTRIISLMNGITSEERIAERYGWTSTVLAIAQGMDAAYISGALTYSHTGEIRFGAAPQTDPAAVRDIDEFLTECGISHVVEDDMRHRLWIKFMLNVGINQTCMAYGGTFGTATDPKSEQFRCFIAAMRETMAVAHAEGVELTEDDLNSMAYIVTTLDPNSMPSMAQDRLNSKPTEVEEFSGTIIRLAEKHNILVPQNRWLYSRIREIEASY